MAYVILSCAYLGGNARRGLSIPIMRKPVWSQRWRETENGQPTSGKSTLAAPPVSFEFGEPFFRIYSNVDLLIAIGLNPDVQQGPIVRVSHDQQDFKIYCEPGDYLAWAA